MGRTSSCILGPALIAWVFLPPAPLPAQVGGRDRSDCLHVVRAYSDCLLGHGRDDHGPVRSPLFAEALDRTTLRLLEGDALKKAEAIKRQEWGLRSGDRMPCGPAATAVPEARLLGGPTSA